MKEAPHHLWVHLAALDYGRNPDIGTLKKYREGIFSECCTESFKKKLLWYVNEVLFEMVKTALKDKYPGTETPKALQNEVYNYQGMYYDKETRVMVKHPVNDS